MPQKMRRAALASALTIKLHENAIKVVDIVADFEPKTKVMAGLLAKVVPQGNQQKVLFIIDSKQDNVIRSVRNLEDVTYDYANQLNAYEVMTHTSLVLSKAAVEALRKSKEVIK
jgi:large subunit ribosomal protein L4